MRSIRAALMDAVVAALPVAIVYFAGWAYLSSYLGAFEIDATQVTIPVTTVLVYAFRPISDLRVLIPAIVILLAWQYVALNPKLRKIQIRTSMTVGVLLLVMMMFTLRYVASDLALEMAEFVWKGEKSISNPVLSKNNTSEVSYKKYADCEINDEMRQVIGFPDQMFVLCVNKKWPGNGVLFLVGSTGTINYYAGRRRHGS